MTRPPPLSCVAACLSLDYTCFTRPECMVDHTAGLSRNLNARSEIDFNVSMMLFSPMFILVLILFLRAASKYRFRKDFSDDDDPANPTHSEMLEIEARKARNRVIKMPTSEFICTVLMVVPAALAMRVARDQITWGTAVPRNPLWRSEGAGYLWTSGLALLGSLFLLYTLWAAMAALLQRARRGVFQHPLLVPKDLMHLSYLVQPYRASASGWQLLVILQQFLVFTAAWIANNGINTIDDERVELNESASFDRIFGNGAMALTLFIMWLLQLIFEPWESAYQNATSARLYAYQFVAIGLGVAWQFCFNNVVLSAVVEALLIVTLIVLPFISILYLILGVCLVSFRIAVLTEKSVTTGPVPMWIKGMRWEEMPIPAAAVVIPAVYDGAPTAERVLEALDRSVMKRASPVESEEEDRDVRYSGSVQESARKEKFTKSFEMLLQQLGAPSDRKSSGLTKRTDIAKARVQKALGKQRARFEGLTKHVEKARAHVEEQLGKYKASIEGPTSTEATPATVEVTAAHVDDDPSSPKASESDLPAQVDDIDIAVDDEEAPAPDDEAPSPKKRVSFGQAAEAPAAEAPASEAAASPIPEPSAAEPAPAPAVAPLTVPVVPEVTLDVPPAGADATAEVAPTPIRQLTSWLSGRISAIMLSEEKEEEEAKEEEAKEEEAKEEEAKKKASPKSPTDPEAVSPFSYPLGRDRSRISRGASMKADLP